MCIVQQIIAPSSGLVSKLELFAGIGGFAENGSGNTKIDFYSGTLDDFNKSKAVYLGSLPSDPTTYRATTVTFTSWNQPIFITAGQPYIFIWNDTFQCLSILNFALGRATGNSTAAYSSVSSGGAPPLGGMDGNSLAYNLYVSQPE